MVKKVLLISLIIAALFVPVYAENHLQDDADIFKNDSKIEAELRAVSEKYQIPIYLVTTAEYYSYDPMTATDYLLIDRVGINNNGILLSINMASRDIYITSSGPDVKEDVINDQQLESIYQGVGSHLSRGDYDEGAIYYTQELDKALRGNYISLKDMLMSLLASLFGAGSYGLFQYKKYKPSPQRKRGLIFANADWDLATDEDRIINSRSYLIALPRQTSSGGSGSTISTHTTGGGTFRGGGGKF